MYLKSLYLHNFRVYGEAYFEFCPHVNIICGANAIGKTSLLEAIYLLSTGRSFRTHQSAQLIKNGASHFYLEALFVKHGIEQKLRISYSAKEKKIFINNTPCSSVAALYGVLLSVALSPVDLELINGPPQGRRSYLDTQLAQIDPLYFHHMIRYSRAMKQRNFLLKAKNLLSIESWEHEMAVSASYIVHKRRELIKEMKDKIGEIYCWISGNSFPLILSYKSMQKMPDEEGLLRNYYLEQYSKNRYRESLLASTLTGPHRDDIFMAICGYEARSFASEGEKRSSSAALRLAEWQQLKTSTGQEPLMLVDEVGANLDRARYQKLISHFDHLSQVFVTATEKPPFFSSKETKVIELV